MMGKRPHKVCVECKHCIEVKVVAQNAYGYHIHHGCRLTERRDKVDGLSIYRRCDVARSVDGECGEDGKLWEDKNAPEAKPDPEHNDIQERIYDFARKCFGPHAASSRPERLYRVLEEVFELVQAGGIDRNAIDTIADYVYGRPVERYIRKELAGSAVTLYAAASAFGVHLDDAVLHEIEWCEDNTDLVRRKNDDKPRAVRGVGRPLPQIKR